MAAAAMDSGSDRPGNVPACLGAPAGACQGSLVVAAPVPAATMAAAAMDSGSDRPGNVPACLGAPAGACQGEAECGLAVSLPAPLTRLPAAKHAAVARRQPPALALASLPCASSLSLVEVEFDSHESPLGLVVEWSLPLPVISAVLPGSYAASRPALRPGLVLIAIGSRSLHPHELGHEEVEAMLQARPLRLSFEAPECSPEYSHCGLPITPAGSRFGGGEARARRLRRMQRKMQPLSKVKCQPEHDSAYFTVNHGKVLTTCHFGAFERLPKKSLSLSALPTSGQEPTTLPPLAGQSRDQKALMASTWSSGGGFKEFLKTMKVATPVRSREAIGGLEHIDPCYQHIVKAARSCGPGAHADWPLLHEDRYVCRLRNFLPARCISDAYETGFQGRKRKVSLKEELSRKHTGRFRKVDEEIEKITCDICGVTVATSDQAGFFYYCGGCKVKGNRYEVCPGCHANEILQGEGKHVGLEVHPHFLRCSHGGVVKQKNLRVAYPSEPYIWRVFCDLCGQAAARREDDTSFWSCTKCPNEHGVRFELCEPCASDLLLRGGEEGKRLRLRSSAPQGAHD
eukprot:gnl/TRDRNA2_/TRDRNA2_37974_c0_seq1.p1 gnl/TRDRNA2_/TRDRNA2_37974_c0~~gnl/TRDRNA2_/TRDRNA2_37974_c0_seq1.p1  ORF type:complete len:583 (-),score=65.82 gnl/TRDRNA2_/TRDRNA2_37974_c0_seq1:21-1733(-)